VEIVHSTLGQLLWIGATLSFFNFIAHIYFNTDRERWGWLRKVVVALAARRGQDLVVYEM
jgi:hypothetical protein